MKGACAHPSTQHTHTNAGERKEKAVKNMAYNMNAARCSQQYRFLANICTKEPLSSACTQRHGEAKREKGEMRVSVRNGLSSAKAKEKLLRKKKKKAHDFQLPLRFHSLPAVPQQRSPQSCAMQLEMCHLDLAKSSVHFVLLPPFVLFQRAVPSLLELLFLQGFKQTKHCHFDVVLMPGKKK